MAITKKDIGLLTSAMREMITESRKESTAEMREMIAESEKRSEKMMKRVVEDNNVHNLFPVFDKIMDRLDKTVSKEEAKNFATKEDLKDLEIKLRGEANENYLALKYDIDEVVTMMGVVVQELTPKKEFRGLEVRVVKLEDAAGILKH